MVSTEFCEKTEAVQGTKRFRYVRSMRNEYSSTCQILSGTASRRNNTRPQATLRADQARGIRFHPDVSAEEVTALSFWMDIQVRGGGPAIRRCQSGCSASIPLMAPRAPKETATRSARGV